MPQHWSWLVQAAVNLTRQHVPVPPTSQVSEGLSQHSSVDPQDWLLVLHLHAAGQGQRTMQCHRSPQQAPVCEAAKFHRLPLCRGQCLPAERPPPLDTHGGGGAVHLPLVQVWVALQQSEAVEHAALGARQHLLPVQVSEALQQSVPAVHEAPVALHLHGKAVTVAHSEPALRSCHARRMGQASPLGVPMQCISWQRPIACHN